MKQEQIKELFENINRMVNKFSQLNQIPRDFGAGFPLNPAEMHVIHGIGQHPGVNVTELADRKSVSPGAISQILKKLEKKQLIIRYKDPDNRKIVRMKLTTKGEIVFHQFLACYLQMQERFAQNMPEMSEEHLAKFVEFGKYVEEFIDELLTVNREYLREYKELHSPKNAQQTGEHCIVFR